jgi:two-component system, sensor histidine kinase and response regulator
MNEVVDIKGSLAQTKILVVEDNLINQKVLKIILDKAGYSYDIAEDGLQAVQKFKSGTYKLVLMDCQMPNLDGLRASQIIRDYENENQRTRCPIVAMTANAMKGDKERCVTAGMDDFLAKPFKSGDLMRVISTWGG